MFYTAFTKMKRTCLSLLLLTFVATQMVSAQSIKVDNRHYQGFEAESILQEFILSSDIDFSLNPDLLMTGWKYMDAVGRVGSDIKTDCKTNSDVKAERTEANDSDSLSVKLVYEYLDSIKGLLSTDSIGDLESLFIL